MYYSDAGAMNQDGGMMKTKKKRSENYSGLSGPSKRSKRSGHPKPDSTWGKVWYFIWHDNSIWSWLVNIILAFVLIKFIFYPGLGLVLGSDLPVVAVVSESMDHGFVKDSCQPIYRLCGVTTKSKQSSHLDLDSYWDFCGDWYKERGISKEDFNDFPLRSGFSKGDIIVLVGKDPSDIDIGDIIVFQARKPYPIIHRVVNKTFEDGKYVFQTKGDHNPSQISNIAINELAVPESSVIGVGVGKIPFLGWVKIGLVDLLTGGSHC